MAIQKFLAQVSGQIKEIYATVTSAGASNAGQIPALDATGKLDATVMPVGIGATTKVAITSEALAIGAMVNIYDNAGVVTVRNANATDITKPAHGYVLVAVASGGTATVFVVGENNVMTGLTTGSRYYLSTTAGAVTTTAPSATGNSVQVVGYALDTTTLQFHQRDSIQLA